MFPGSASLYPGTTVWQHWAVNASWQCLILAQSQCNRPLSKQLAHTLACTHFPEVSPSSGKEESKCYNRSMLNHIFHPRMMTFQPGFSVLFSSVNSCLSLLYLPRIFKLFFMKRNLFSEPSNVFSLQFFKQHSSRSLSCYSECKSAHQLRTQRAVGRGNNTRTDSLGTVEIGQQFTVRILNQVPPPPS